MRLKPGHRFEPEGNWAIFQVVEVTHTDILFRVGPSVSDQIWSNLADAVQVTMSHRELQRLIDQRLMSFDDQAFDWDDPDAKGEPRLYPTLQFPAQLLQSAG